MAHCGPRSLVQEISNLSELELLLRSPATMSGSLSLNKPGGAELSGGALRAREPGAIFGGV